MKKDSREFQIMVVEDNEGDFFLIQDYLEEEIAKPVLLRAENFGEARLLLKTVANSHPDVILLDLTLPDRQGEDLINEMVDLSDGIPIIVLTGYSDVNFAIRALSHGVQDYLLKDNLSATILYKSIVYNLERNKYLVKLRESEQRYADLFHLSPQPMWVYDLETLRFLDVNAAAVKHYGYGFKEFLSMTIEDIRPESELPRLYKAVEKARKNEKLNYSGEFIHRKKNGEEIIVDVRSNIIQYKNKKAEVVLANDITDRYKHVLAIERQNDKLREIAWTQSHVIRAPLARIMGLINLISEKDTQADEKEELLSYIMVSARELDVIIQDVVKKSKEIQVTEEP